MQNIRQFIKDHQNLVSALSLVFFLYLFFLSLQLMGDSLKLFGKDFSATLIQTTTNPFIGLFIGILATSIVQSSSSTTSIVVGMVAAGALNIENAIPIIMGANIGTSVTSFIAAFPQINRVNEFKRAFAAATVHDFFNLLSVLIIFPLQIYTNFLGEISTVLAKGFINVGGLEFFSIVKVITKPVSKLIINFIGPDIFWVTVIVALALLFLALKYMVSSMKVLVVSKAKALFDNYLFKTGFRAFLVGLFLTVSVQSSTISVSLMVPLASAGILTLYQIFPYSLGANIGTTITAMLAALITGSEAAVVVAFSHLLFNISGIIIWWPLKVVPITISQKFAEFSTKSKIIPVGFVLIIFFILPLLVIFVFN